ncbi:Uncharacterised protein [Candidatus Anstonella stagnisolia]|nr:Uncharacterised protein [Candidatus Anstonella stagnisolia]
MKAQMFVDLAGAFLVLMLVAASGFGALEKAGRDKMEISAACAQKNLLHSYADWFVKEGGTASKKNADGGGYYLQHEVDLGRIGGQGRGFDVFVSYADEREIEIKRGAESSGAGNYFCVKRIALCDAEICAVRVCGYGSV